MEKRLKNVVRENYYTQVEKDAERVIKKHKKDTQSTFSTLLLPKYVPLIYPQPRPEGQTFQNLIGESGVPVYIMCPTRVQLTVAVIFICVQINA